jgi:hypothetical protein
VHLLALAQPEAPFFFRKNAGFQLVPTKAQHLRTTPAAKRWLRIKPQTRSEF